jgi:hypothetical protein
LRAGQAGRLVGFGGAGQGAVGHGFLRGRAAAGGAGVGLREGVGDGGCGGGDGEGGGGQCAQQVFGGGAHGILLRRWSNYIDEYYICKVKNSYENDSLKRVGARTSCNQDGEIVL